MAALAVLPLHLLQYRINKIPESQALIPEIS
jgi:hypothetical protein